MLAWVGGSKRRLRNRLKKRPRVEGITSDSFDQLPWECREATAVPTVRHPQLSSIRTGKDRRGDQGPRLTGAALRTGPHMALAQRNDVAANDKNRGQRSLDTLLFASPEPRRSTPARNAHVASSPALKQASRKRCFPTHDDISSIDDGDDAEDLPSAPTSPSSMCISPASSLSPPKVVADGRTHDPMELHDPRDALAELGARSWEIPVAQHSSILNKAPSHQPEQYTRTQRNTAYTMSARQSSSIYDTIKQFNDRCHMTQTEQQEGEHMSKGSLLLSPQAAVCPQPTGMPDSKPTCTNVVIGRSSGAAVTLSDLLKRSRSVLDNQPNDQHQLQDKVVPLKESFPVISSHPSSTARQAGISHHASARGTASQYPANLRSAAALVPHSPLDGPGTILRHMRQKLLSGLNKTTKSRSQLEVGSASIDTIAVKDAAGPHNGSRAVSEFQHQPTAAQCQRPLDSVNPPGSRAPAATKRIQCLLSLAMDGTGTSVLGRARHKASRDGKPAANCCTDHASTIATGKPDAGNGGSSGQPHAVRQEQAGTPYAWSADAAATQVTGNLRTSTEEGALAEAHVTAGSVDSTQNKMRARGTGNTKLDQTDAGEQPKGAAGSDAPSPVPQHDGASPSEQMILVGANASPGVLDAASGEARAGAAGSSLLSGRAKAIADSMSRTLPGEACSGDSSTKVSSDVAKASAVPASEPAAAVGLADQVALEDIVRLEKRRALDGLRKAAAQRLQQIVSGVPDTTPDLLPSQAAEGSPQPVDSSIPGDVGTESKGDSLTLVVKQDSVHDQTREQEAPGTRGVGTAADADTDCPGDTAVASFGQTKQQCGGPTESSCATHDAGGVEPVKVVTVEKDDGSQDLANKEEDTTPDAVTAGLPVQLVDAPPGFCTRHDCTESKAPEAPQHDNSMFMQAFVDDLEVSE